MKRQADRRDCLCPGTFSNFCLTWWNTEWHFSLLGFSQNQWVSLIWDLLACKKYIYQDHMHSFQGKRVRSPLLYFINQNPSLSQPSPSFLTRAYVAMPPPCSTPALALRWASDLGAGEKRTKLLRGWPLVLPVLLWSLRKKHRLSFKIILQKKKFKCQVLREIKRDKNSNRTELLKVNVFYVYIVSKQLHHVAVFLWIRPNICPHAAKWFFSKFFSKANAFPHSEMCSWSSEYSFYFKFQSFDFKFFCLAF